MYPQKAWPWGLSIMCKCGRTDSVLLGWPRVVISAGLLGNEVYLSGHGCFFQLWFGLSVSAHPLQPGSCDRKLAGPGRSGSVACLGLLSLEGSLRALTGKG